MSGKSINGPEQAKLKQMIAEGITVMQEVEDLNAGLNDAIKALAEELDIKSSLIKKAIKIAMKGDWERHLTDFEDLEALVDIANR